MNQITMTDKQTNALNFVKNDDHDNIIYHG